MLETGLGAKVNDHAWIRVRDTRSLPFLAAMCGIATLVWMMAWPGSWVPVIVFAACLALVGLWARGLCKDAYARREAAFSEFRGRDDVRKAEAVAVTGDELTDFLTSYGVDADTIVSDSVDEAACIVRNAVARVPAMLAPNAVRCHAMVMRFDTDEGITCEFLHIEDACDHSVDEISGLSFPVWYATGDDGSVTQVEYGA